MPYNNPKELLNAAITTVVLPIEERLPEGAPVLSDSMLDAVGKMPVFPDFPMEVPDLPPFPELPEFPTPGEGTAARPATAKAKAAPVQKQNSDIRIISSPAAGVLPEVITRRGM